MYSNLQSIVRRHIVIKNTRQNSQLDKYANRSSRNSMVGGGRERNQISEKNKIAVKALEKHALENRFGDVLFALGIYKWFSYKNDKQPSMKC